MPSTTLTSALSASATSITVPDDANMDAFPEAQFEGWIGTEQVIVVAGPPGSATWTIVRDQAGGSSELFLDTFDRDSPIQWGNGWARAEPDTTSVVGSDPLTGTEGHGMIVPPIGGGDQPFQTSVSVLDSEIRVRFFGDVLATDEISIQLVFRDSGGLSVSASAFYRANLTIRASDQLMRLRGEYKLAGDATVELGGAATSTGMTFTANTDYFLLARCSGTNPTTLEMKAWLASDEEPGAWTRTDTDSFGPQVAGYPGIRAGISGGWTGGALTVTFKDYAVNRIPVGIAWPAGTIVQPIEPGPDVTVGAGYPTHQPQDGAFYADRTSGRLYLRLRGSWHVFTPTAIVGPQLIGPATLPAPTVVWPYVTSPARLGGATLPAPTVNNP